MNTHYIGVLYWKLAKRASRGVVPGSAGGRSVIPISTRGGEGVMKFPLAMI